MLNRYLNNLKIHHKLLLLLALPLVALLIFATDSIVGKWQQYNKTQEILNLHKFSQTLANVVHSIQIERGLSSAYFGSNDNAFKDNLAIQRKITDQQISLLNNFSPFPKAIKQHVDFRKSFSALGDIQKKIEQWRASFDNKTSKKFFEQYSEINSQMIYLIQNLLAINNDALLARKNHAYGSLLWLQEYAGQERGEISNLLVSGHLEDVAISIISGYAARQDSLLSELLNSNISMPGSMIMHKELEHSSIAEVENMRRIMIERISKLSLLDRLYGAGISSYSEMKHQFKPHLNEADESHKEQFQLIYIKILEFLNTYRTFPNITKQEQIAINSIEAAYEEYEALLGNSIKRAGAGFDEKINVIDKQVISAFAKLRHEIPDIDVDSWFSASTKRIEQFKKISDNFTIQSMLYVEKKTNEALSSFIIYSLVTFLILSLSLYLSLSISRRLVLGTASITKALKRVERSGNFTGYIAVKGNDEVAIMANSFNSLIKERKSAENKLLLASRVFDNTIDGIIITDLNQNVLSVNRAFSVITGYSSDEILGKTPKLLSSGRHDDQFYKQMWQSINTKGYWQGEIWNRRKSNEIYPVWQNISAVHNNEGQLINYIAIFSDISVMKASQEHMEYLAHHDALTQLPNRLLFDVQLDQALERARRNKNLVAVLFFDLDRFKNINDSLGHPVGDALLKQVALRLKKTIRAEDLIARFGGDEFAIILEPRNERGAAVIAKKCIKSLASPFNINYHEVYTSASIGISLYPHDGDTPELLIKNADTAMYHAKERGRNNYRFYNKKMSKQADKRLRLENRLRGALARKELILHYQPQISFTNGNITGAEVLVRWNDQELGPVSPTQFIPIAEESGLIEELDQWVLGKACEQLAQWQKKGLPPIHIAVNISGFIIEHSQLPTMVESALKNSGLDAKFLELEITESYLMQHKEKAAISFAALKEKGVTCAIDDFGTGYSSLSYLKELPIDRLKIDKSFVKDIPGDTAIATAIIALGHSMQLKVVAEGVENSAQKNTLFELECDFCQGALYGMPMSASSFEGLLIKQAKATNTGG